MLKAWEYLGRSKVVILAKKDDFTGVPQHIKQAVQGVVGASWGDSPGSPLPDKLIRADRSEIEDALATRGCFSS